MISLLRHQQSIGRLANACLLPVCYPARTVRLVGRAISGTFRGRPGDYSLIYIALHDSTMTQADSQRYWA